MKRDAQFTLRLSSELLEKLRQLAQAEDRSLAYYVERLLRKHVEAVAEQVTKEKLTTRSRDRSANKASQG